MSIGWHFPKGLGHIAQLSKCLQYMHKEWSLVPKTHMQKPTVVACTCNPTTSEAEAGTSLASLA